MCSRMRRKKTPKDVDPIRIRLEFRGPEVVPPVQFNKKSDGVYTAEYTVSEEGEYKGFLTVAGEVIKRRVPVMWKKGSGDAEGKKN